MWRGVYLGERHLGLPEFRRQGYGSALLAEVEAFGKTIGSQLIISTRGCDNRESSQLFSHGGYAETEQVVITKPTPG